MEWWKKPSNEEEAKAAEPFNPPHIEKTEKQCEVDGCFEEKAPGQNHVCVKHVRSS